MYIEQRIFVEIKYFTLFLFSKISVQTECPADGSGSKGHLERPVCYDRGAGNGQVMRCSSECLGGCLTRDDNNRELKLSKTQNECYSCKNFLSPMSSEKFSAHGNHVCWPQCSIGYVVVSFNFCLI